MSTPPRRAWVAFRAFLGALRDLPASLALSLIAVAFAALSNLIPIIREHPHVGYPLRVAALVGGLILLRRHIAVWARTRGGGLNMESGLESPAALTGEELLNEYRKGISRLGLGKVSGAQFAEVLNDILKLDSRESVREVVRFRGSVLHRQVEIVVRPNSAPVHVLSRPYRGDAYRAFSLESTGVEIVSYRDTFCWLFMLTLGVSVAIRGDLPPRRDMLALAEFVATNRRDLPSRVCSKLLGRPPSPRSLHDQELLNLLEVIYSRRVILFRTPSGTPSNLRARFSYEEWPRNIPLTSATDTTRIAVSVARGDRWPLFKSAVKEWLHQPPQQISIPIGRSKQPQSYSMQFSAPEGTYVQHAQLIDFGPGNARRPFVGVRAVGREDRSLPIVDRDKLSKWFCATSVFMDGSGVNVATALLHDAPVSHPYLRVNFRPRPPGHLGFAVFMSFATLILIWITAVLVPRSPDASFDIIAVSTAIPGLLIGVYNLRPLLTPFSRSFTGRLSLYTSLGLSLLASVLYLAFDSGKLARDGQPVLEMPPGVDTLFVTNWLWLLLFLVAAVNATWTASALRIAVVRQRTVTMKE